MTTSRDGLVYEAGWRHRQPNGSVKTMKRRLGPAWLVVGEDGEVRPRRGRVKPGFLDQTAAILAKDKLVREIEQELADKALAAEREKNKPATFRQVAHAYLHWLAEIKDAKPSTLRDHEYLLAEPGTPYRRGTGVHDGTIMKRLGDLPAVEVTTRQINDLLTAVVNTGVSSRTVNKHRQLISAIYGYATHEATFALPRNPARAADRRAEPPPAQLNYYATDEVETLAASLAAGGHRDPDAPPVSEEEADARAAEDRQDAELVRVAAYAGLRRGELVALRWRDADFTARKLTVRRAVSADVDMNSTKSRKAREVPLPDQAAQALQRLHERGDYTTPDDHVFTSRLGRRLDGSALRRRVQKAQAAAGLRPLRFHDLRHSYGSLLVAGGIDLASVKAAMGHARLATTERYLHARPATKLADKFTQALRKPADAHSA